ncbi:MAG TPA: hypothetical protein DEH78_01315 [Solibacterales bacterium]|nr:hypothetical protein [Bryobacterales bacterium]
MDTSVVVAGIAALRERPAISPSAKFLREWLDHNGFKWLVTEEILAEYKAVLSRLNVRRSVVGALINLLREEAGQGDRSRRSAANDCAPSSGVEYSESSQPPNQGVHHDEGT